MAHDGRGAAALLGVGGAGVVASLGFGLTRMDSGQLPIVAFGLALALAFSLGGLLRFSRGKPLSSPITRREEHLKEEGTWGRGLLRLFAFLVDAGAVVLLGAIAYGLLKSLPWDDGFAPSYHFYDYASGKTGRPEGLEMLRLAWPHLGTRSAADEIGAGLGALLGGLYLLVPAALYGGTPGLLLVGRVWTRASDGERVGALHGALRALGGLVVAPLPAGLIVLGSIGGGGRYRDVRTGQRYRGRWALSLVATARRSVADVFFRTEAVRRKRAEDGRG